MKKILTSSQKFTPFVLVAFNRALKSIFNHKVVSHESLEDGDHFIVERTCNLCVDEDNVAGNDLKDDDGEQQVTRSMTSSVATEVEAEWKTKGGTFKTHGKVSIEKFCLPQFSTKRKVNAAFYTFIKKPTNSYDIILGRDICQALGLDVINSKKVFTWDDISVAMVPRGHWNSSSIAAFYQKEKENTTKVQEIEEDVEDAMQADLKPAIYEAVDVNQLIEKQGHLDSSERDLLQATLKKHIKALQGLRGKWREKKVHLELLPEAKPFLRLSV